MNFKRVSVGFGLRVNPEKESANRYPENQHLVLRVHNPICADASVWVEDSEIEHLTEGVLPDFANPLHLAKSIDLLVEVCKKQRISTRGLWPVCITSSEANVIVLVEHFGHGYFDNQPTEEELLARGWKLMGFDIVDLRGMISGLKGCGYTEPTWSRLRNLFGEALNEVGLFSDSLAAFEFAQVRGAQIRAHAPFVVVGILKDHHL